MLAYFYVRNLLRLDSSGLLQSIMQWGNVTVVPSCSRLLLLRQIVLEVLTK